MNGESSPISHALGAFRETRRCGLLAAVLVAIVLPGCSNDAVSSTASSGPSTTAATSDGTVSTTTASTTSSGATSTTRTSPPSTGTENARTLRVGTSLPDNPPFTTIDGEAVTGFEADLVAAIAANVEEPVAVEWVIVDRPDAFTTLGETHDIYLDLVPNTQDRSELFAMSSPYLLSGWTALVPAASPVTTFDELSSISVTTGTSLLDDIQSLIAQTGLAIKIVSSDDPLRDVENGTADGAAVSSITVIDGFRTLDPPVADIPISMAVDDAALRDEIDATLVSMISDGTWLDIYDQWFDNRPPYDPASMSDVEPKG